MANLKVMRLNSSSPAGLFISRGGRQYTESLRPPEPTNGSSPCTQLQSWRICFPNPSVIRTSYMTQLLSSKSTLSDRRGRKGHQEGDLHGSSETHNTGDVEISCGHCLGVLVSSVQLRGSKCSRESSVSILHTLCHFFTAHHPLPQSFALIFLVWSITWNLTSVKPNTSWCPWVLERSFVGASSLELPPLQKCEIHSEELHAN